MPIYGASEYDPLCYLLEIDDTKILLDCGWDINFDVSLLKPLEPIAKQIHAVLLSHADIAHLGALPYAVGKLGLRANIYATAPVYKMGLMFMYDAYESRSSCENFEIFNLDDVDAAFEKCQQLKYLQRTMLAGGIEITPHLAGHIVGGTIWKIKKETEEIVYAVDFNHKKEKHLNGTVLETLARPELLITDTSRALYSQPSRKLRDAEVFDLILKTLQSNGNVLLPVDASGRVLELLVTLDQYWIQNKPPYPIIFLSYESFNTIEFAKSQLEWMSDAAINAFDHSRENVFALKSIRLCYEREQLDSFSSPKVVLSTMPDMESGFSRDIFLEDVENEKNLIIFTDRSASPPGSLAFRLLEEVSKESRRENSDYHLSLIIKRRVPLEGAELEEYRRKKEEQHQQKLEQERKQKEAEAIRIAAMNAEASDEDDEDEDDMDQAERNSFQDSYDMTSAQFTDKRFKYPLFPFSEKRTFFDDYGENITFNDFSFEMGSDSSKEADNSSNLERRDLLVRREDLRKNSNAHNIGINEIESPMETDESNALEVPTKFEQTTRMVNVRCDVKYVDFEGRSDGRSIKTIIQHVSPRKMILVHGSEEAKEHLKNYCEKTLKNTCKRIVCPKNNERFDVTSDSNIYKVKLKDSLYSNLEFHEVGDYKIARIDGRVHLIAPTAENLNPLPLLEEIPSSDVTGHGVSFIGDLKLADLKQVLSTVGYKSELYGGMLVTCEGSIALKKKMVNGQPRIKIEGILSEDYFKIRNLLYSQFKIL